MDPAWGYRAVNVPRMVWGAAFATVWRQFWRETRCAACRAPCLPEDPAARRSGPALCPACVRELAALRAGGGARCPRCGLPLSGPATGAPCGECLVKPPPWGVLKLLGPYEGLLRDLVLRAKFRSGAGYDAAAQALLGARLAEACADLTPDAVTPLPLHPARLRTRGFNQCLEMARPLGRTLGVALRPELLRRVEDTPPQRELSGRARRQGLAKAFAADPAVRGLRILLVDDVMTTGTTLRRAAACLDAAGALVDVAVAARTGLYGHNLKRPEAANA